MMRDVPIPSLGMLVVKARDLAGRPVRGLRFDISYPGGTPYVSHITDRDGEVRLSLAAREYVVRADAAVCFEWDRVPHRVRVREDGITRVVFSLPLGEQDERRHAG